MTLLLLFGGLVALIAGGEALVRGASRLARLFGIPTLVVGLTIVAFGTGAPELAVTIQSVYDGESDLVLGNVVGSNIANVLLVLGISALAAPLVVSRRLIRLDVPLMIGVSVLMWILALDGVISKSMEYFCSRCLSRTFFLSFVRQRRTKKTSSYCERSTARALQLRRGPRRHETRSGSLQD